MKLLENKGRLAGPYVLSVETAQRCLLYGKTVAVAVKTLKFESIVLNF